MTDARARAIRVELQSAKRRESADLAGLQD
jgi:hypothetical protein